MRTPWMMIAGLLVACAEQISQVPADRPHGTVQFRVIHEGSRAMYEDEARLDFDTLPLTLRQPEPVLRVSPGRHYAELISRYSEYELGFEQVDVPRRSCADIACTPPPLNEVRHVMRPSGEVQFCQGEYDVDVEPGSHHLALLIVSEGARTCRSCVSEDPSARKCP